jgi:hypothetical protein
MLDPDPNSKKIFRSGFSECGSETLPTTPYKSSDIIHLLQKICKKSGLGNHRIPKDRHSIEKLEPNQQ